MRKFRLDLNRHNKVLLSSKLLVTFMVETPVHMTTLIHRARVPWVDYTKAICIFLVLMLHANTEMVDVRGATGWLGSVVEFARPFRMPDFFLVAGLFLSHVIDKPWRVYLDKKVLHFLYFYLVWTTLYFVLFGIKTALNDSGGAWSAVLRAYLLTFVQPNSSLWFIYSLATFFLVVRITRVIPWWLVLAVAALLQMANIHTGWLAIDEFCSRFVYFFSGYIFARRVFQLAEWGYGNRWPLVGYLLVWGVVNQMLVSRGWAALPGVGLALGYVGAAAIVFCGVLLSRIRWARRLRYLGETSIVLYLGDYLIQRVALKSGLLALIPDAGTAALLLTFISVFGTLVMFWAARRFGFSFMYKRPEWARLKVEGVSPLTDLGRAG
jgi:uncharacterized membrane protein YcfT